MIAALQDSSQALVCIGLLFGACLPVAIVVGAVLAAVLERIETGVSR